METLKNNLSQKPMKPNSGLGDFCGRRIKNDFEILKILEIWKIKTETATQQGCRLCLTITHSKNKT